MKSNERQLNFPGRRRPLRSHKAMIAIFVLMTATLGCGLASSGGEVLLAPTEVGDPAGERLSMEIGPAGGTLTSADGRMTLKVPANAVNESVTFSIQPITNKAANGVGNGYRLEPDGRQFPVPVEVSMRFEDKDIEGTAPEALYVAYQDKNGSWRADPTARLDTFARTITVSTDHFTDYSTFTRLRLIPPTATVRVGKAQIVQLLVCAEQGLLDRILSRPVSCEEQPPPGSPTWKLEGPGRLQTSEYFQRQGMMFTTYIAPARKPDPNVAIVKLTANFTTWNTITGERRIIEKTFESRINIVGSSYRATGSWGGMSFSGTVCSLDKPFTIYGKSQLTFNFRFTPSSGGTQGTVGLSGGGMGVSLGQGSGSYEVTGAETETPRISVTMDSFTGTYPGVGSAQGSGTRLIQLEPLETNECDGQ